MARKERSGGGGTKYVDSYEENKIPNVGGIVLAVRAGVATPRDVQDQVATGLLSSASTKLLAERYAYTFLDKASESAPAADTVAVALMAWSMACATVEMLTRRVEKLL